MKLTKYIRDAFVSAALADIPTTDFKEQIRKLVLDDAVTALPPDVRKAWKDSKQQAYINTTYDTYAGVSVFYPHAGHGTRRLSEKAAAELAPLHEAANRQEKLLSDLRERLSGAALACSTRKALAEMLPEFAKYLPAELETSRSLPVVTNLVTDFVKAGWPKGADQKVAA